MSIRVNTLPGLRVLSPSGDAGALAGRRLPQALLVYLAVERSATRDSLLALLWPERDDERARHSLSQALHELRSRLGEECIGSVGDVVSIGDAVETDLARFEAAVEGGRWAEALELYGGDFLDGAHLAPTHGFEEWLDRRRAQVARLHRRARRELVAERLEANDLTGALAVAERWAEVAPLDDEAQLRTVELLARTGRRADALAQYERFRELLRADELEPMPDLVQLAADVAAGRLQPAVAEATRSPTEPAPPIVTAAPSSAQPPLPGVAWPPAAAVAAPAPSRAQRARDLLVGVGIGLLVGAPSALLAAGLLHAIRPQAIPVPFGPAAPALVAALALAILAGLLLLWLGLRGGAGRGPGARGQAGSGGARVGMAAPSRRLGAGVGFALGVLVTLTTAYAFAPGGPEAPRRVTRDGGGREQEGRLPTRVVVTHFVNRAGDPALEPVARLAEDWVTRRLGAVPEAEVVATAAGSAADTGIGAVTALARRTGAELVLFGSVYREGSDVLLSARAVPPSDSKLPREMAVQPIGPVRAPLARPVGGAERLAALIAGAVAAQCRSPECAPGRRPPTYEARAAWLDALTANTQRGDTKAAQDGLRRAIALDSTFVNAYTGLANSYLLQRRCPQVDSIGEILEARQADFAQYDLLYMRAMRATCRGDLDAAYQYRAEAVHIAPTNVGAQWGAAEAAAVAGRLQEAERRLAAMADTWYRDEFYYYTLYTGVLHLQGKIADELRLAEVARARLPDAAHRFRLGLQGLAALGRTADIEARFAEARRSQMRYVPLADLYGKTALELEWHGHAQAARQFTARALQELERATPAERKSPDYRVRRAILLVQARRWREARPLLDAVSVDDEGRVLGGTSELSRGMLLTARGVTAAKTGDPAAARAALAAIERLPEGEVWTPQGPSREACEAAVLAALGETREALSRLADGQARGTIPRSSPGAVHAELIFRDLWHNPVFDSLFAARD